MKGHPIDIPLPTRYLPAGEDWFGAQQGLAMSRIAFKVVPSGENSLLILENTFQARGGPPRHLHLAQDEWFYIIESEFVFEVGSERFHLRPGDSLLAPRQIPHVWAHVGPGSGRILVGFTPAGQMLDFFRTHMQGSVPPPTDPAIWLAHGMQLLGPPLPVE